MLKRGSFPACLNFFDGTADGNVEGSLDFDGTEDAASSMLSLMHTQPSKEKKKQKPRWHHAHTKYQDLSVYTYLGMGSWPLFTLYFYPVIESFFLHFVFVCCCFFACLIMFCSTCWSCPQRARAAEFLQLEMSKPDHDVFLMVCHGPTQWVVFTKAKRSICQSLIQQHCHLHTDMSLPDAQAIDCLHNCLRNIIETLLWSGWL